MSILKNRERGRTQRRSVQRHWMREERCQENLSSWHWTFHWSSCGIPFYKELCHKQCDGPVSKGAYHQAWWFGFDPLDQQGKRRELNLLICSLVIHHMCVATCLLKNLNATKYIGDFINKRKCAVGLLDRLTPIKPTGNTKPEEYARRIMQPILTSTMKSWLVFHRGEISYVIVDFW